MSKAIEATIQNGEAIAPVIGYPVYDGAGQPAGASPDSAFGHYNAGYLVVLGLDDSGLRKRLDLPECTVAAAHYPAPAESSAPGNSEYRPDPKVESAGEGAGQGMPSPAAPPPQIVRNMFAKLEDGQVASHKIVGTDAAGISAQIEEWRQALPSESGALPAAAPVTAGLGNSDVNPNPEAWTLLGGKTISVAGRGWFSPWYYNTDWQWWDTGVSNVTVSLYRLNSKDAFDFFLVKTLWTVSPKNQRKDFGGIWFYNRDHRLQVQLSASTAGGEVSGDLINFEPKTVPSSQTYSVKFGGDLNGKIGEKPEAGGKVSAEIATSFTIPSVSTNSTINVSQATWELQHDYGPGWGRGIGQNWPDTTVSGATAVTWSLYRFGRAINDGSAPVMSVRVKLTGNFGSVAEKFWGMKQELALAYESSQELLQYTVPTMSYEPVYTAENPLEIAPGNTATVQIRAGAPGMPLQWQPYGIPKDKNGREYLIVSPSSGDSSLGDGPLKITAAHFAEPGAFGYIRVNSLPWTATDSLRRGGLDIPVKIVG